MDEDSHFYSSAEFSIEDTLDNEYRSYIVHIKGTISIVNADDSSRVTVGSLSAQRVEAGQMLNDECFDPVGIADGESGNLGEAACEVWPPYDQLEYSWSDKVEEALGPTIPGDLLYISSVYIDPKYRGMGIGLNAVRRCIELFSGVYNLVAIKPFPSGIERDKQGTIIDEPALRKGIEALGNHWGKLGFVQLKDSEIWVLSSEVTLLEAPRISIDVEEWPPEENVQDGK